ncbi:telomerase inhibitor [Savitreella phatthalungensis]
MGLAGVKKNTRIQLDPRNTRWADDTSRTGYRLLAAQGWVPGSGLGGSVAGRTDNIRQRFRDVDDVAGLGCAPAHAQEWSGLQAFNDIFTRVNAGTPPPKDAADDDRPISFVKMAKFADGSGRAGLRARFVLGETYTSEMSKRTFYKQLGLKEGPSPAAGKSSPVAVQTETQHGETEKELKQRLKAERKLRKAARAERREARAAKRAAKDAGSKVLKKDKKKKNLKTTEERMVLEDDDDSSVARVSPVPATVSGTETPTSGASTPTVHGRFAHRAKYQRAKQGGRLDAVQLAQVLGVRST